MPLLVICEIFVNTLTPDDKYSLRNSEPLLQPIQTQLSKKKKKKFFSIICCISEFNIKF